jgi:hypothetical protein
VNQNFRQAIHEDRKLHELQSNALKCREAFSQLGLNSPDGHVSIQPEIKSRQLLADG